MNAFKFLKKGLMGPNILFPAAYIFLSADMCNTHSPIKGDQGSNLSSSSLETKQSSGLEGLDGAKGDTSGSKDKNESEDETDGYPRDGTKFGDTSFVSEKVAFFETPPQHNKIDQRPVVRPDTTVIPPKESVDNNGNKMDNLENQPLIPDFILDPSVMNAKDEVDGQSKVSNLSSLSLETNPANGLEGAKGDTLPPVVRPDSTVLPPEEPVDNDENKMDNPEGQLIIPNWIFNPPVMNAKDEVDEQPKDETKYRNTNVEHPNRINGEQTDPITNSPGPTQDGNYTKSVYTSSIEDLCRCFPSLKNHSSVMLLIDNSIKSHQNEESVNEESVLEVD